jgi:hypothetical protein
MSAQNPNQSLRESLHLNLATLTNLHGRKFDFVCPALLVAVSQSDCQSATVTVEL